MAIVIILGLVLGKIALKILKATTGISLLKDEEDEVDEELGTYWECVSEFNKKVWYLEEVYNRKHLNFKTMDNESLEILKTAKTNPSCIGTQPNYEMLQNPKYAEAFQFTSVDMRDTEEEREATDMVI